jgi:aminopeptidase N
MTPPPTLTRIEAQARAALLRPTSYDVALDVTGAAGRETFRSRTTVAFDCARPGADTFVDVAAESLRGVWLNGVPLAGHADQGRLALRGLAERNVLVVDGDFRYSGCGQGLHRFTDPADGAVYLYSMTFLAESQRMYACFDQPDLKAAFTFHVTAPRDWQVVSNAAPASAETSPGGARTVHFTPTRPIPTYITAVAAGPYHRVSDTCEGPGGPIDLGLYCRASLAEYLDPAEIFAVTKAGFDFYHRAFDYPYPFGKYDQIFAPQFNGGGMENAGAVIYRDEYVFRSRVTDGERRNRAYVLLHELAHMWFGNLVTARWWDDTWLNESFATFAGFLSQVEATRWTTAWTVFGQRAKSHAYRLDQAPTTHPISSDVPDLQAAEANFDDITYSKGASVLKQLVAYVGRDAFLRALRGYFRRHEYANATLADLLAALQRAGGRDLTAWSAQWLETAQVNTLRPEFTVDQEGRFASFGVVQSAAPGHPTLRTHRLAIGLYADRDGRLERTGRVEADVAGARTEIPELVGLPRPDLVLVNDDDLTYAKVRFDPRSLRTLTRRIGDISESLPRALCWTAAWDMTRDGELPAGEYVDVVLGGIDDEDEISVFEALLANVETALRLYTAPGRARADRARLAETAWAALERAEPGGDRQLAWSHAFARTAGGTGLADILRALYDERIKVEGLALDLDARWRILHGLIAHGAADAGDIEAELARDPNSTAERYAATARALRPDPAAKAHAWDLSTGENTLPALIRKAYADGFWHHAQTGLLEPYVSRYFDSLDEFWTRHDGGIVAKSLTEDLFPMVVAESTVAAADAWLARPGTPSSQRRLVLEQRDELTRALRNRHSTR